ncbi:MAG TPA: Lrp/AsnC family transcriptional regulator [Solirubrobacteraceae bacterium]
MKRKNSSDIVPNTSSATGIRTQPAPGDTRPASNSGRPAPALLDEVDRAIIKQLQHDGRASNTEIGRELGLTEATIRKRVNRLVGEGLISIVAVPTPDAVGMTTSAIIGISVQLQQLHAVSDQLVSLPEVRYVGASTGRYDLIVEAFFSDHEHLLSFVSERLGSMSGVTDIETSLILKVAKFSYEWEIP